MTQILIFLLLPVLGLSLHTSHFSVTSGSVYLQNLVARQTTLINSMSLAMVNYQTIANNIHISGAVSTSQILAIENFVKAEQVALRNLSNYINAPTYPTPCNSTTSVINSKNTLKNEATLLKKSVLAFRTALVNCVNCAITAQLNKLIIEQ